MGVDTSIGVSYQQMICNRAFLEQLKQEDLECNSFRQIKQCLKTPLLHYLMLSMSLQNIMVALLFVQFCFFSSLKINFQNEYLESKMDPCHIGSYPVEFFYHLKENKL